MRPFDPAVLAHPCPFCAADVGKRCKTRGGSARRSRPHKARKSLTGRWVAVSRLEGLVSS